MCDVWLNPHEVVGRLVLVLALAGVGANLLAKPDTQLTTEQLQKIGKQRSKDKANARLERKKQKLKRKKDDNAKHSVGYCKRCGIYD
jgi:predicted Zn-ribbon and HTH transcriptional regulator